MPDSDVRGGLENDRPADGGRRPWVGGAGRIWRGKRGIFVHGLLTEAPVWIVEPICAGDIWRAATSAAGGMVDGWTVCVERERDRRMRETDGVSTKGKTGRWAVVQGE